MQRRWYRGAPLAAPAPAISRLIPGRRRLQGLLQAGVGSGGLIKTLNEFRIGLLADHHQGSVEQGLFRRGTCRIKDEIGAVLATCLVRAVDQAAYLGFDAQIQRVALGGRVGSGHGSLRWNVWSQYSNA